MSIKVVTAQVINEKNRVLINEFKDSLVERTVCNSYLQDEDSALMADNDECSFVKGYN
jgi:hypothetical protein